MFKIRYFNGNLSSGFIALFSGRIMQFIADSFIGLFLPIFLFQKLGYDARKVLLFFGLSWLLYAIFLPWGAQILNKIGLRRSIRISVFIDCLFFYFLYLSINSSGFLIAAMVARILHMLFYWLPYHTDFAKFTNREDRGKEYSLILAAATVFGVALPAISGFIIDRSGFSAVFIITIIILLAVFFPFMFLPRTREKFSWTYGETLRHFFAPRNRNLIFAHMASGAENIIGTLIWPIFIWTMLKGEYFKVGVILAFIAGVTIILQLLVGNWTDKFNKRKLLKLGTFLYAAGWILKATIVSAFQIFFVGVYHNFSAIIMRTPFDSLTYELAADQGHFVDEFTVIKEMAVQLGRILMIIAASILLVFASVKLTFLLAAAAALSFNLIPEEKLLEIKK